MYDGLFLEAGRDDLNRLLADRGKQFRACAVSQNHKGVGAEEKLLDRLGDAIEQTA